MKSFGLEMNGDLKIEDGVKLKTDKIYSQDGSTVDINIEDLLHNDKKVIFINSISELLELDLSFIEDNQQVSVKNYHIDSEGGGGIFYWNATADKSDHNGGTIIDPDVVFPTDWSDTTEQETWFTVGSGTGCWVKMVSESVNVEEFGAKGDGVTDDRYSMQNTLSTGIKVLLMANKVYTISKNLYVKSSIEGGENSEIKIINSYDLLRNSNDASSLSEELVIIRIENTNNVEIKNIILNGNFPDSEKLENDKTVAEFAHCIKIYNSSNITVTNCILKDTFGDNIYIGGNSNYIYVLNNRMSGNLRSNIAIVSADNIYIQNNTLYDYYTYVAMIIVEGYHTENLYIKNNIMRTDISYLLKLYRISPINEYKNIYFEDNDCVCNHILWTFSGGDSITWDSDYVVSNIYINNNNIIAEYSNYSNSGLVRNLKNLHFSRNNITIDTPILFRGTNIIISDNIFQTIGINSVGCVSVNGPSDNVKITGNLFSKSTSNYSLLGIRYDTGDMKNIFISNNSFKECLVGIELLPLSTSFNVTNNIINNNVFDCIDYAIKIRQTGIYDVKAHIYNNFIISGSISDFYYLTTAIYQNIYSDHNKFLKLEDNESIIIDDISYYNINYLTTINNYYGASFCFAKFLRPSESETLIAGSNIYMGGTSEPSEPGKLNLWLDTNNHLNIKNLLGNSCYINFSINLY